MSKLDDILTRNAERKKLTSRKATLIVVGVVVVVTILLELFTDLGMPKVPPRAPAPTPPHATRVDDVKLMPARPPAPAANRGSAAAK